eukprot:scaffold249353_cov82-Cyclotella_meneghiniana.AAC.26
MIIPIARFVEIWLVSTVVIKVTILLRLQDVKSVKRLSTMFNMLQAMWRTCKLACPKHRQLYAATTPKEPVNLFGSVSTERSTNDAVLHHHPRHAAECEACKEVVDHVQCFRPCRELARISFDVKSTGHRHLCLHCWHRLVCPTYGHVYDATPPIEPVNLFGSVSTAHSTNNAALPSSTTNESRRAQGNDFSNNRANSLPRSCTVNPITHANEDNFSDCDSELARMDLSNINKGVKRTNPYIENNRMNFNEDNNKILKAMIRLIVNINTILLQEGFGRLHRFQKCGLAKVGMRRPVPYAIKLCRKGLSLKM